MKQISISFLALVFLGLLAISCNNNSSNQTDKDKITSFDINSMKTIIKEKSAKFTQAHITRDTAFLNNIFAKDAKVYAPNSDVVIGRSAISAVNSEWVNYGIKEFTEETTSFYGNEEYLIDEGNYFLRYGEEDIIDNGKYINIWKKENDEWKLFSNMWNTSMPLTTSE